MGRERYQDLTIEQAGLLWADDLRERLVSDGEDVLALIRDSQENEQRLKYPFLTDSSVVRFSPFTGHLFIPQWRSVATETFPDGRRAVKSFSQFAFLGKEEVDLVDLPQEKPLVELVLAEVDGLEPAIRQQAHILEKYQPSLAGEEVVQVEEAVAFIRQLADYFLIPGITKEQVDKLALNTFAFLKDADLLRVRDQAKKKMVEQLIAAAGLDSRGRVNPMISRVHLRSAYLQAVRREVVNQLVVDKYRGILRVLLLERSLSRWALASASQELDTLAGLSKRGHIAFEENGFSHRGQKEIVQEVVKRIAHGFLVLPRTQPYIAPARAAAISLLGCRSGKEENNFYLIASQFGPQFASQVLTDRPASQFIDQVDLGYLAFAKEKIAFAQQLLDKALEDNQLIFDVD